MYGDELQDYVSEPMNEYQKKMRKNSDRVLNHIGSIPSEKTKK